MVLSGVESELKVSESSTLSVQMTGLSWYLSDRDIDGLAVSHFRDTGKGITWKDVFQAKYAKDKKKAQDKLKYHVRKGVLFTIGRTKPQQYFPTSLQSEIMKNALSTQIRHNRVGKDDDSSILPPAVLCKGIQGHDMDGKTHDMLVGSILHMLPKLPFFIHKMNFNTTVPTELYNQLELPVLDKNNQAKRWESRVGSFVVNYWLYPNGTLMIYSETSDRPFRLQTESDLYELMAFVGEMRRCISVMLNDIHGRLIPRTTCWFITQCDINRDIPVDHAFHTIGLNVRWPYLGRIFHIYIKCMGKDTVARVEEELSPNERFFQFLENWFDPEWVAKQRQEGEEAVRTEMSDQQSSAKDV